VTDVLTYKMYIDSAWVSAADWIVSSDPWECREWARVPQGGSADVDRAVTAADEAFRTSGWAQDPRRRATTLRRFADMIDADSDRLADVESRDNGKLRREVRAGFAKVGEYFDSIPYGANIDVHALTRRVPYGVVGIQTPWNTPGVILAQSAAPALAAGNTIVVKPPELAPCSTLELAALAEQAGFPRGVVNVVTGYGPVVGAALCAHELVSKLVFTGSPEAGVLVATHAARRLVPCVLELGGKAAHLVFPESDVARAADGIVNALVGGGGQSCMCGSRALIHESVYDDVVGRVVERLRTVRLGDPRDPTTDMGPLCTQEQVDRVAEYVASGIDEGGRLLCGGEASFELAHPHLYQPTVLADLSPTARVCQEEVFGPVLTVFPFSTQQEAIDIANGTAFGLAAMVWTESVDRAHRVSDALRAGVVFVNQYRSGDPAFANGGRGRSGYGRVSGVEGFVEMTQPKSIQMLLRATS
jgi:aldehyde dehydrogenase (NAD+)